MYILVRIGHVPQVSPRTESRVNFPVFKTIGTTHTTRKPAEGSGRRAPYGSKSLVGFRACGSTGFGVEFNAIWVIGRT